MPTTPIVGGAARQYLAEKFGGLLTEHESHVASTGNDFELVQNNPDRLGLFVMNTGAFPVYLSTVPGVTIPNGVVLTANGGAVSMDVSEDFTLPSRSWHASSVGQSTTLFVLEMVRDTLPPGA
jgi:hypothetical protein